jgi:glucose-1-phosphate adenylyltransferase
VRIVRQPLHYIETLCRETAALVLAGGRSSRLRQLARLRAPPAASYGGKYRIVDFSLSNCMNSGVRRVGVATQYEAVQLTSHIQRAWGHLRGEMGEWVGLLPARQEQSRNDWYRGTADAVFKNLNVLGEQDPTYLLVLAGDQIYTMDYHPLIEHHARSGVEITVGAVRVPAGTADRLGIIERDGEGLIRRFVEKPADPLSHAAPDGTVLASMGIYVFNFRSLREILSADAEDPASRHDFGHDVIPALIDHGHVGCYPYVDPASGGPAYWRDVGTVDAYYRAQMDLVQPVPELNLYDEGWPIWSYEPHLPPARLASDTHGRSGRAERSLLASGSVVIGAEVTGSIVSCGSRIERSAAADCVLLPGVQVEPGCRLRGVILDEEVVLPAGTEIGFEPEADRARFHVTDSGIVLVTREMLIPGSGSGSGSGQGRDPSSSGPATDGREVPPADADGQHGRDR